MLLNTTLSGSRLHGGLLVAPISDGTALQSSAWLNDNQRDFGIAETVLLVLSHACRSIFLSNAV